MKVTYKLQVEKVKRKSWNDPHPEYSWEDYPLRGQLEFDSMGEIILALQYFCVPTIRLVVISRTDVVVKSVYEHVFGD